MASQISGLTDDCRWSRKPSFAKYAHPYICTCRYANYQQTGLLTYTLSAYEALLEPKEGVKHAQWPTIPRPHAGTKALKRYTES